MDTAKLTRIRADPLFAPLSLAIVEHLAGQLVPVDLRGRGGADPGGRPGDHYYLIEQGRVVVSQAGRRLRDRAPGASVGEIALLYDVPRTASVRARRAGGGIDPGHVMTSSELCGQTASRLAARTVAMERLAAWPTGGG